VSMKRSAQTEKHSDQMVRVRKKTRTSEKWKTPGFAGGTIVNRSNECNLPKEPLKKGCALEKVENSRRGTNPVGLITPPKEKAAKSPSGSTWALTFGDIHSRDSQTGSKKKEKSVELKYRGTRQTKKNQRGGGVGPSLGAY